MYYCSKTCQGSHWPVHKDLCKSLRRTLAPDGPLSLIEPLSGKRKLDILNDLRLWRMTHQDALNFVTIQALQLDIFPERAKNQFLEIDLEYASDQSRDRFIIKSGRIHTDVPAEEMLYKSHHGTADDGPADGTVIVANLSVSCGGVSSAGGIVMGTSLVPRVSAANWLEILRKVTSQEVSLHTFRDILGAVRPYYDSRMSNDPSLYLIAQLARDVIIGDVYSSSDPTFHTTVFMALSSPGSD